MWGLSIANDIMTPAPTELSERRTLAGNCCPYSGSALGLLEIRAASPASPDKSMQAQFGALRVADFIHILCDRLPEIVSTKQLSVSSEE